MCLLLVLIPVGFPNLFELPLRSRFASATPGQARLLLYRFSSSSELVDVSCSDVAVRPKAALSPLVGSLASCSYSLLAGRILPYANMAKCHRLEVKEEAQCSPRVTAPAHSSFCMRLLWFLGTCPEMYEVDSAICSGRLFRLRGKIVPDIRTAALGGQQLRMSAWLWRTWPPTCLWSIEYLTPCATRPSLPSY